MADTESCDCVNGTAENGWHETRGPRCKARELDSWRACGELRAVRRVKIHLTKIHGVSEADAVKRRVNPWLPVEGEKP